jgi:hypothetical protein
LQGDDIWRLFANYVSNGSHARKNLKRLKPDVPSKNPQLGRSIIIFSWYYHPFLIGLGGA